MLPNLDDQAKAMIVAVCPHLHHGEHGLYIYESWINNWPEWKDLVETTPQDFRYAIAKVARKALAEATDRQILSSAIQALAITGVADDIPLVVGVSSFCNAQIKLDSDACIAHIQYRVRSLSAFLDDVCDQDTFERFVRKLADTVETDSRGLNGEVPMKMAKSSIHEFLHSSLGALPKIASDVSPDAMWHDLAEMLSEGYLDILS